MNMIVQLATAGGGNSDCIFRFCDLQVLPELYEEIPRIEHCDIPLKRQYFNENFFVANN